MNSAELNALASDSSHVFQVTSIKQMLPADNGLKIALALCSGNHDNMSWPISYKIRNGFQLSVVELKRLK